MLLQTELERVQIEQQEREHEHVEAMSERAHIVKEKEHLTGELHDCVEKRRELQVQLVALQGQLAICKQVPTHILACLS